MVFVAFIQHCIQSNVTHLTNGERAHNIFTHNEIFFEKLRPRAFQLYHQILCMLKHVDGVETTFDPFNMLRHM